MIASGRAAQSRRRGTGVLVAFGLAFFSAGLLAGADAALAQFNMPPPPEGGQQGSQIPGPMRPKQFPTGQTFEAASLNGRAFDGERPAVTLDETFRLRGFAGCNNYSATAYPLRDQGLAVGPFALTRRQCDAATMRKEREFLEALRGAQRWDTDGPTLTIQGQRGTLTLQRAL